MAVLIQGTSGADALLAGTPGPDAILGYDQAVTAGASQLAVLEASRLASGLDAPVFVTAPALDPDRLFIVEKAGRVVVLDLAGGGISPEPFLDLTGQVATSGEQGLLGLAFHPDFANNRRFYVHLSNLDGDSEVREYLALPGAAPRADPASARLILRVDQPAGLDNHKGGWIGFGPDGQLYLALGDGGGVGDPLGNGQNPANLLGTILRLDPGLDAFPADPARNYGIPAGNPFAAGGPGAAAEVWAYGLRNPWRDSFDRATGELWIADVGQARWEEIDLGTPGANFGWNRFEGPEPFTPGASAEGLSGPLFAYGRDLGGSVTGGHVYRGPEDALQGAYLFSDFVSGRIWSLARATSPGAAPEVTDRTGQMRFDAGSLNSPVSFGEDAEGRLYVVDFDGEVFRLTPRAPAGAPVDAADLLDGAGGDDGLFAGAGADRLLGGDGADTLFGMAGADTLEGGSGPDRLWGGDGDDRLSGGTGADWIHGGAGTDAAVFTGLRGDYAVSLDGGVVRLSDRRAEGDGTDLVSGVELFAFADGSVARDALLAGGDPLFDAAFYLAANPDVAAAGIDPAAHYAAFGWREGRDPNALFDTDGYLAVHRDVAASGMNPLDHYTRFGGQEGRDPSAEFDLRLYLVANPDVAAARIDPLAHYLRYGAQEGRARFETIGSDIRQGFDGQFYIWHNLDVARAGIEPLAHYRQFGWREGRDPDSLLDTGFYLAANPDVAAAGMDPLEHYMGFGWREGRDPGPGFATSSYLAANPDVAQAGLNPLEHYLIFGIYEGRLATGDSL